MPCGVLMVQVNAVADASRWSGCDVWKQDAVVQSQLNEADVQCKVLGSIDPNRVVAEFDARIGKVLNSTEGLPYSGEGALTLVFTCTGSSSS